ncbi:MFS transporter [Kitasatospora camelliae]|uniref:MFS transporter n=1 Tax=Kitasatospora camelliae TaxID=3156397 RepID=A0AAU8K0K6_9ACTN
MRSYQELFRVPEFAALFVSGSLNVAAGTVSGLALATLVFDRTGSPLLAAVSMFGASFAQVIGAALLLSAADRLPPRRTMAALGPLYAAAALALAWPGLPVPLTLAVLVLTGLANSVGGAVRWGLISEIVPAEGFVLARSVLNISAGTVQILGNGCGVLLLGTVSPRGALVLAAGLYLAGALVVRCGLSRRPARVAGRPSVRETWRVNRVLLADPAVRCVYLALWVPNGLVVGVEALFVPYAGGSAGVLFMAGAGGMLAGDVLMGRFVPARYRAGLLTPVRLLLAVPMLLFWFRPGTVTGAALVAVATVGFSAGLLLQERLRALVPVELHGQALGLHGSGMLAMQAVGATLAGALAEYLPTGSAMAVMAAASTAVTLALAPGLRRPVPRPRPEVRAAAAARR